MKVDSIIPANERQLSTTERTSANAANESEMITLEDITLGARLDGMTKGVWVIWIGPHHACPVT